MDKIVQGNTSNIVFLKSTDDSMIETLSKMSGTMHVSYRDSKTVTKDVTAMMKMTANEGKVSYTVSTVERPVLAYNDFAQIPPCNSIVFRAGDLPIWNRNETALPMSWRLFKNTIVNPGKEYTLQTIPSLSTAKDFDVKQNQPNFSVMFEKRLNQAVASQKAAGFYKDVYGLTDDEIQRLDVDVYSDAIMEIASQIMNPDVDLTKREDKAPAEVLDTEPKETKIADTAKPDDTVEKAMQDDPRIKRAKDMEKKIYANGRVSRSDLMSVSGQVTHSLDTQISVTYSLLRSKFKADTQYFRIGPDGVTLLDAAGVKTYIRMRDNSALVGDLAEESKSDGSRIYNADGAEAGRSELEVTDDFIRFLCKFDEDWPFCRGEFSQRLADNL